MLVHGRLIHDFDQCAMMLLTAFLLQQPHLFAINVTAMGKMEKQGINIETFLILARR